MENKNEKSMTLEEMISEMLKDAKVVKVPLPAKAEEKTETQEQDKPMPARPSGVPFLSLSIKNLHLHMEPVYEEQIQALLRKAFAEKFKLGEKMDAEVHEVMQMISKAPIDNVRNQALRNLSEKLREIHDFDQMEQEGDFLKRQLSAVNYSIRDAHQHIRDIQAEKEALKVRSEVLGEPIEKEAVTELEDRLLNEEEQLEKLEHETQQQAEQVRYMEDYWKKLEQTYEIREKTLQWLDSLAGGTQMFLDEAVGTYVKAFVLSVTIFSPKHFRIHWFDDTCTDVECDSVFEGYQQPGMIRRKY